MNEARKSKALIETQHGLEVIRSGETARGASRFKAGHGRHGSTSDI